MVGVTGSFEVICKVDVFDPLDMGLKATQMVRVLPGLIVLLPLPLMTVNIDASVSVIVEVSIERLAVPVFLTLKEAAFLLLTFTFPKS